MTSSSIARSPSSLAWASASGSRDLAPGDDHLHRRVVVGDGEVVGLGDLGRVLGRAGAEHGDHAALAVAGLQAGLGA